MGWDYVTNSSILPTLAGVSFVSASSTKDLSISPHVMCEEMETLLRSNQVSLPSQITLDLFSIPLVRKSVFVG